jgi:hydrogenase maturation protein HypF
MIPATSLTSSTSSIGTTRRVARRIHIAGIVQGVGFRPYVFRLARAHDLAGWVLNGDDGVHIHVEGGEHSVRDFLAELPANAPPAAQIAAIEVEPDTVETVAGEFEIRHSESEQRPTTRIAPDLPVCDACLGELFDPADRRFRYPYINCTNCGPRYSIVRALPYDRARTTMAGWPLCPQCAAEYHEAADRRFHAQPVACPRCGPAYRLVTDGISAFTGDAIATAARLLRDGRIVAIKGIGGYHLCCDAGNAAAIATLRERKYRKEQAFAVMVRSIAVADRTVELSQEARSLLMSAARPIVLAPAWEPLPGVAPENRDLGVMLPYAPLHHLLFAAGAPERLVMTSGNRSSEPIAYTDDDAAARLDGLADAFLAGERPIARRVDDSVVRAGSLGPVVLRRSRGLAPSVVATMPCDTPILAVGGDLKNAVTLVVDGQAYVSQHIGDLSHPGSRQALAETIGDLLEMYAIAPEDLTVVHDLHPEYASRSHALEMRASRTTAVQHHRAHVASVLAERGAFDLRVLGVALDGTGYGDDGGIWGGEFFAGSLAEGFTRVACLRHAALAGGDAAARHPVQAAAGFVAQVDTAPDLGSPPFLFPKRYHDALALVRARVRVFPTTSAGRLFDTVAALLGFTRPITFEGQAAMWLEHLGRGAAPEILEFPCPLVGTEIDWRDTLAAIIDSRRRGLSVEVIARAFHRTLARAIASASLVLSEQANVDTVVLSGGVMQNDLLLADIRAACHPALKVWTNRAVPPNDGGLSLGQAAMAAMQPAR